MQLPDDIVVDPFGEVNLLPGRPGMSRVRATILMPPAVENAAVGIGIDASKSMLDNFGGASLSPIFKKENQVEVVARTLSEYLASFSGDGFVSLAYWSLGPMGALVSDVGRVDGEGARTKSFGPPANMGTGTQLLPAVKHFTDGLFRDRKWSLVVFVTDGVIDDLEAVLEYTVKLANQISSGSRGFTKLVLIGLGDHVNPSQMERLDDCLDDMNLRDREGNDIDIWDHSLAATMKSLAAIFKEVVSRNTIVAKSAVITDDKGNPVKSEHSFADGLPAIFEFELPSSSKAFTVSLPDGVEIRQPLG